MNDLVQTPQMVADYFSGFARERGLETKVQVMAPGDRWDSEEGFRIQPNHWFEDRPAKLAAYRERVRPTLERQAAKEARTSLTLKTVQRFFDRLGSNVPAVLTRPLKGTEVLLVARSGEKSSGFAVDLHGGGKVREVSPADFDRFDKRIEFPTVILRQALAMNMFQHAGISKRVHFYATGAAMPQLKRFVTILELAEAEVFPLRANLNARAVRALAPRWREGLLYARAAFDMARGNELPDLEEKYLEELA
jgi:hypothetical protein